MSAQRLAGRYGELADLQKLAAIQRRDRLAEAIAESDRCTLLQEGAASEVALASERFQSIFSGPLLCIDRMRLAGADLNSCEASALASRRALEDAKAAEDDARFEWNRAQRTADWFGARSREIIRKGRRKTDERTVVNAISLRLSLGKGQRP